MGREDGDESDSPFPSMILEEWWGNSPAKLSKTAIYTTTTARSAPSTSSVFTSRRFGSRWSSIRSKIIGAFLPEGFPESVTQDYIPFQMWDSLQGLSTYIRSMLSTQALLSAIGVGEKSATVIGATFQWFLRDFTGMLGGILFTFYQGSNLDSNAKMWRLVADFMNDLGMLMDLISPLFPSALVPIVCLGSLSRSFTGVASGATRAALTQHFSLENNAADISAKEGSQETLATMVGMALGMFIAQITRGNPVLIWTCFLCLTAFHIYANYKAVCCLSLRTLNSERSSLLLQHFMKTDEVLSPNYVSTMEHVFPPWISLLSSNTTKYKLLHRTIYLGVRVSSLKDSDMMELWRLANSQYYVKERYLLLERKTGVFVFVHKDSTPADTLRSFFHALVIANMTGKAESFYKQSQEWMDEHYQSFIPRLRSSGWKTERLLSPAIIWRANWVHISSDNKQD
ncbi:hypothetical protein ZOSMA_116G00600 [Zostera marina]|uniref:Protein root UVB sensitive 3 n=1 Tax=Zostera marina TaxID=29655 RepID=A0A0K9Q2B3_ZOSMR|nr:hypothetical protein ZOSMA_116G00600 [Zostera marina]